LTEEKQIDIMLPKMERVFNKEELKKYDGKNGNPVYVAYKGEVYDVTGSELWKDGTHWYEHTAGSDLTNSLDEEAPHTHLVLERFPKIGKLKVFDEE